MRGKKKQMDYDRTASGSARHLTIADYVAAELHAAILSGELAGGSALPIAKLAEKFGTSPMPVRDALRRLAGIGAVEITPHRGARVMDFSVEDLHDTYDIRAELEGLAISRAAVGIDAAELDRAAAALEMHVAELQAGRLDEARIAHREFHFVLYAASDSPWLMRAIEPVWQNSERYRFAAPGGDHDLARSHQEHLEILQACRNGDADGAVTAVRKHILGAMSRIRQALRTTD